MPCRGGCAEAHLFSIFGLDILVLQNRTREFKSERMVRFRYLTPHLPMSFLRDVQLLLSFSSPFSCSLENRLLTHTSGITLLPFKRVILPLTLPHFATLMCAITTGYKEEPSSFFFRYNSSHTLHQFRPLVFNHCPYSSFLGSWVQE